MLNAINRQTAILPGDLSGQVKPQNLEQAAEQFEALMLRSMLSQCARRPMCWGKTTLSTANSRG